MSRTNTEWEKNAQKNPMFSVLTDDNRSWTANEFFSTGEVEIGRLFQFMASRGIEVNRDGNFVDIGCGLGRNTRALMKRFGSGIGWDVSPTMIEHAKKYARDDPRKADYRVGDCTHLTNISTGTVDFIFCHIVLQHMPLRQQERYIAEFMRILRPGGLAAFQIPIGFRARDVKSAVKLLLPPRLKHFIKRALGGSSEAVDVEMHRISPERVARIVSAGDCRIEDLAYTNSTEPDCNGELEFMNRQAAVDVIRSGAAKSHFLSGFYFVRK